MTTEQLAPIVAGPLGSLIVALLPIIFTPRGGTNKPARFTYWHVITLLSAGISLSCLVWIILFLQRPEPGSQHLQSAVVSLDKEINLQPDVIRAAEGELQVRRYQKFETEYRAKPKVSIALNFAQLRYRPGVDDNYKWTEAGARIDEDSITTKGFYYVLFSQERNPATGLAATWIAFEK